MMHGQIHIKFRYLRNLLVYFEQRSRFASGVKTEGVYGNSTNTDAW